MRLVGFNFSKIRAEKIKDISKDTKANTKINILDVSSLNATLIEKKAILKVDFSYIIEYTPGVGLIELEGHMLLSTDTEQATLVIDAWKGKKLGGVVKSTIFNIILRKANVKALELEEDLNLPLHIPMPSVKPKEEKK